jgi:uncharacterized protein
MQTLPGAEPFPDELAARLSAAVAKRPSQSHAHHRGEDSQPRFTNRLALESSPYLLGHAHNPVNWYAWGDDAFAEGRRLGRPIFLSIGYSTCHWCHVMERESFEDETIASLLNAHFVAIKVDREERPDVDAIYLRAAQQISGSGGWPLSVWLTATREPFFAGTYFPPHAGQRGAGTGFMELLTTIARLWDEERPRVQQSAQTVTAALRKDMKPDDARRHFAQGNHQELVATAVAQCRRAFDPKNGGLRLPQKFPSHVPTRLLLRHHQRTGDAEALNMAVLTLERMAAGGIYDQVAGGFHRYATDPLWLVPHFEKMLYDNALLVVAYAEAWQVTKRADFARVVRETCDELLATFASPEGAFHAATDADSEGEEGKFFVWSAAELRDILGPGEDTELFLAHYDVTATGNFELGNVLHVPHPDETITERLAPARARLAQVRSARVHPLRDDKILAAWNGLALSALAYAGRVLGDERYLQHARRVADFLTRTMRIPETGRLARSLCEGRRGTAGFLSDYAFVAAGLLDLFESTHEPRWFHEAMQLCRETQELFADEERGGWFVTSHEHESLLARESSGHDGAEPAGASVALMNALRLAAYTDDKYWRQVADTALARCLPLVEEQPLSMGEALLAVDFAAGPVQEIVLTCKTDETPLLRPFIKVLRQTFCPRRLVIAGDPDASPWRELATQIPWSRNKPAHARQATAYVCRSGQCELPAADPAQFAQQLASGGR